MEANTFSPRHGERRTDRYRHREIHTQREMHTYTERQTDAETDRDRDREKHVTQNPNHSLLWFFSQNQL